MKDYVIVDNYSGLGKVGISRKALATIASKALVSFKEASLAKDIDVSLPHEGPAVISMELNLKDCPRVGETCVKIQQEVASQIAMMCENLPVNVKVRVNKVS